MFGRRVSARGDNNRADYALNFFGFVNHWLEFCFVDDFRGGEKAQSQMCFPRFL